VNLLFSEVRELAASHRVSPPEHACRACYRGTRRAGARRPLPGNSARRSAPSAAGNSRAGARRPLHHRRGAGAEGRLRAGPPGDPFEVQSLRQAAVLCPAERALSPGSPAGGEDRRGGRPPHDVRVEIELSRSEARKLDSGPGLGSRRRCVSFREIERSLFVDLKPEPASPSPRVREGARGQPARPVRQRSCQAGGRRLVDRRRAAPLRKPPPDFTLAGSTGPGEAVLRDPGASPSSPSSRSADRPAGRAPFLSRLDGTYRSRGLRVLASQSRTARPGAGGRVRPQARLTPHPPSRRSARPIGTPFEKVLPTRSGSTIGTRRAGERFRPGMEKDWSGSPRNSCGPARRTPPRGRKTLRPSQDQSVLNWKER